MFASSRSATRTAALHNVPNIVLTPASGSGSDLELAASLDSHSMSSTGTSLQSIRAQGGLMAPGSGTVTHALELQGSHWSRFAAQVSVCVGTPLCFYAAAATVGIWLGIGHPLKWGTTWQLIMNTISSVTTFLMVFLLQTSQNRDARHLEQRLMQLQTQMQTLTDQLATLVTTLEQPRTSVHQNVHVPHEKPIHALLSSHDLATS